MQSNQEEPTEVEEMKQQQRMKFVKDLTRNIRSKGRKDAMEKMKGIRQHKVAQMIESAEGSAGLLQKIPKPTAWRGGAQILVNDEENARLLDRCDAKMKEWQSIGSALEE